MNSMGYKWVFDIDSISTERHRAEVRRAYSDDRLAIVAERYIRQKSVEMAPFSGCFTHCWFHSRDSKKVVA